MGIEITLRDFHAFSFLRIAFFGLVTFLRFWYTTVTTEFMLTVFTQEMSFKVTLRLLNTFSFLLFTFFSHFTFFWLRNTAKASFFLITVFCKIMC